MRPAYTKALFYPSIDIKTTDWLKKALLFWDHISTIVPDSLFDPYRRSDTRYLESEGVLSPIMINHNDSAVIGIADEVLRFLHTSVGQMVLRNQFDTQRFNWRHRCEQMEDVYKLKFASAVRDTIREMIQLTGCGFFNEEKFTVSSSFAEYYMSLLANRISEERSLALVTDSNIASTFSEIIRLDNQIPCYPAEEGTSNSLSYMPDIVSQNNNNSR